MIKSVFINHLDALNNGLEWEEIRGGKDNLGVRTGARAAGTRGMEVSMGKEGKELKDLLLVIFVR